MCVCGGGSEGVEHGSDVHRSVKRIETNRRHAASVRRTPRVFDWNDYRGGSLDIIIALGGDARTRQYYTYTRS